MFEKTSLGIAFEADGTVRVAELVSTWSTVTCTRALSIEPEGADNRESWMLAIQKLHELNVSLENAVVGIPDSVIFRKNLAFPFSNRKRILQILTSELEGEIPLPMDKVVADFIPGQSAGPGANGTAMVCERETLSWFLEAVGPGTRLKGVQSISIGLVTASLRAGMVDGVAVHCCPGEAVLVEFRSSRAKTVKRLSWAADKGPDAPLILEAIREHTVDEDQVFLGCDEIAEQIESALGDKKTLQIRSMGEIDFLQLAAGVSVDLNKSSPAVGLALRGLGTREAQPFDLRQGPFKQVTPLTGLKVPILRTSALLLVLVLLGITSIASSISQARGEYEVYKGQLQRQFKELFPGSKPIEWQETTQIKSELDNLKKKVSELSGLEGRGALSVLAVLSAAIPADIPLKLEELSYDSNKLRFDGSVSSFDAVDRIKASLDSEPLFSGVEVQNARVGANINKVTFRIQMEVR